ncbi:YbjN domain-containing protein [Streptomyces sp. NPDC007084]|uniref:YbjN domain-containing protein n=1 Tax=Streptomyces sp. NPDC007084 TaxID=3154313 RepID=UPI0034548E11
MTDAGLPVVEAAPGEPLVPDQDLVRQLLDQLQLKHSVDDEGDLVAPWEEYRMYFMFRGEGDEQVFSVRTFYDRPYPPEDKPKLYEWIDDWNRRTLWPKVCTFTPEDGQIRLVGEAQTLIGTGVDVQHFVSCTVSWVQGSIEFERHMLELLGREGAEAPGTADEEPADLDGPEPETPVDD